LEGILLIKYAAVKNASPSRKALSTSNNCLFFSFYNSILMGSIRTQTLMHNSILMREKKNYPTLCIFFAIITSKNLTIFLKLILHHLKKSFTRAFISSSTTSLHFGTSRASCTFFWNLYTRQLGGEGTKR
jgi:hypothetical protein